MNYLLTNPHNAPIVLGSRAKVRDCIRDDYYTAFDDSGRIPGLAAWTASLPITGGRFPIDGGEIVVKPTLRRV